MIQSEPEAVSCGMTTQLRAAAVVLNRDQVLLHKRIGDDFWALPGGRVKSGEDAKSALVREFQEELGERIDCGRMVFLIENFFEHGGAKNHEIGMVFSVQLPKSSSLVAQHGTMQGIEQGKRLDFRWFALSEISSLSLRPACLSTLLAKQPCEFQHLVQRQTKQR